MTSDSSATASPCIGATRQKKRRSILALNTSFNVSIIGDMEGPESVAQAVMTPVSIHTEGGAKVLSTGNGLDQPSNKTSRRSLRADDLLSGKHTPSKDQVINRPNMNDEQLLDHYDTCIQLVNKGKVSAKNAFSLHLIDVMSDVLSSCNKDTFFQMAGCTLDAGAKIYSFRVDNLHSDAYRVANVLGSNKRDDEEGQENMDIEAGMEGAGGRMDDEIPAALKKKRKRNFKCIVSDLSKIHKRVNHNVEHDALYQKASMVIGNTRPTDLLSMHMPVTDCERREKIVIDGSTKVSFPSQNLEGSHFPMIPKSVLNLLEAKAVSQLSLCQSVDKIMEMLDVTSNEHDEDANEKDFDKSSMNRFLDDVNDNFTHDANAPPAPEDDMYVDCDEGDVYDDALRPEIADKTFGVAPHGSILSGTEYDIGNESKFNALEPSLPNLLKHVGPGEFSNFSEHVLNAFFRRKNVKSRNRQPPKKKTSPENVVVQYVNDFVMQASSKNNKALTTLSEPKGDKKKKTCAAYSRVEYDRSQWTSYFELDLDFIKNNSMAEPENMELQEKYDYNNPLDISNARFARTSNNEGDYVDDFGHNFNDDDDDEMPNQDFDFIDNLENDPLIEDNLNLIEAPVCAEQFKINYAKRAKNVDVRKVKRSMLNFLKDHDSEPEASKLTSLFRNARRILKPADVKDLSIHVAFVTLLDLANEQKLELANNDYFTEILVKFATSA